MCEAKEWDLPALLFMLRLPACGQRQQAHAEYAVSARMPKRGNPQEMEALRLTQHKKPNTVQTAEKLIQPVLDELGLSLWDTRFEKEGSLWFLRYFIDKDGGVTINDCEAASRAISKLLDEADPIPNSYTLEVSSPGVERRLLKDWHFQKYIGSLVSVRLVRPVEGMRDFIGELLRKDGDEVAILLDDDIEMVFKTGEAAYVKLYADFETGGLE